MPTTVKQLFKEAGKNILGQVKWGEKVDCNAPGIYVVAISNLSDNLVYCDEAPISQKAVEGWIKHVPKLTLDNETPRVDDLTMRLNSFWLPDETILYIGKAGTSLKVRVNQYYTTRLGDPKPHRGGHWIKTLDNLNDLNIYWTTTEGETAHEVEDTFLQAFINNVSQESRLKLYDPNHPFPYANLEFPKGTRKIHGMQNQANP